jgi:hypothetical protein
MIQSQLSRRALGGDESRFTAARLQLAQFVIEDLVQMGLHLGVCRIDVFAEMTRVLGNLFRAAEVAADALAETIGRVGQLGIDDFNRLGGRGRETRAQRRRRRRSEARLWRRVLRLLWRGALRRGPLLLLAAGLSLGLSAHLSDAAEEFFDFVFHGKFQEPKNQRTEEPKNRAATSAWSLA